MNFETLTSNNGNTLTGPYLIHPEVFEDSRGWFLETWNQLKFDKFLGKTIKFTQDNHSFSNLGVLGDPNEPLLQRALSEISGTATAKSGVVHHPITHTLPLPQDAFLEQMHVQLQKATATQSENK